MDALLRLWTQLLYTHAGVSECWLQRYVEEANFREGGGRPAGLMRRVLHTQRLRFPDIRPPPEPWGFRRQWLPWRGFPILHVTAHHASMHLAG